MYQIEGNKTPSDLHIFQINTITKNMNIYMEVSIPPYIDSLGTSDAYMRQ